MLRVTAAMNKTHQQVSDSIDDEVCLMLMMLDTWTVL
jgi:hypothetical protein